ncbi:hypothetical protein BSF38_03259 [Paludisphaera borealis]|uniref:Uncharacterized protein n=2 Tax=Paludisphaera borealis TaxID=1387353 RepID=A0A1U7CS18_9BACT|nr:hypothetical protein BSF38_03259 [Paludisphaera borealis]
MRIPGRSSGWGKRAWTEVRGNVPRAVALATTLAWAGGAAAPARGQGRGEAGSIGQPTRVTVVRRSLAQDQGAWVIEFEIRNETAAGIVVTPAELEARVEGWVSNSRVASHARPRPARVTLKGCAGPTAAGEVIASKDESAHCRERLVLSIWSDDAQPPARPADGLSPICLAPGASGRLRLRIEHQHAIHGDYDPLLGVRTIDLRVGEETFRDVAALDREHYLAQPRSTWAEPPEDRRDPRQFVSAPDSLHLEAHAPGRQYYRFPDQPVRYGARMRLSFWYLIAVGTSGECRVRFSQYKDTPSSNRMLSSGGFDQELTKVGRWTKVEKILHMEPEATTAALDFRVTSDANLGEMWIDDVALAPVAPDALAAGP